MELSLRQKGDKVKLIKAICRQLVSGIEPGTLHYNCDTVKTSYTFCRIDRFFTPMRQYKPFFFACSIDNY
jgi:hypothetical protein